MKLLDLFSGIGGFSLGMEATKKIKTIAFCEKDEFCRKVLKKHWSNIKQYNDIRSINGKEISADIVSGGFPCQPFSVAGKRKGTEDDRYLWDEMLRVITEVKPRWVVGENVQGIINIDNGLVLRQVKTDLEAQGFQVQCFIIPASGIGAWHKRNRVWIIGCNVSNTIGKLSDGCSSTTRNSKTKFKGVECDEGWDWNEVWSKTERCSEQDKYKTWWTIEQQLRGVPDGLQTGLDKDRTNRIKSLGNSICPQIAREIGLAILKAEEDV
tara:strand:- start:521 stop:1321 length:801 start_codon:yes stop_codon:yes gene_type:complete